MPLRTNRQSGKQQYLCVNCEYDLRGNLPADQERQVTCPECGYECSLATLEEKNRQQKVPRNAGCTWVALALVPAALIAGTVWVLEAFGVSWEDGGGGAFVVLVTFTPLWSAYLASRDLRLDRGRGAKAGSFIIDFLSCIAINVLFLLVIFILDFLLFML